MVNVYLCCDVVLFLSKKDDDDYIGANLRFYRNEIKFRPNGRYPGCLLVESLSFSIIVK